VVRDEAWARLERPKCRAECIVAFVGGPVEPIVRRQLLGHLPNPFDRIQLRRVRWQAEQFDPMTVRHKPELAVRVEVVARPIVDDQKCFATTTATNDFFEELQKRPAVENRREVVQEPWSFFESHDAEDMRGFAHAERIYARLLTDAGPRSVERAVEPEARFVSVGDDTATLPRFFLIAGKVSRNHVAWRARSARASRLRGRCTEKPSWCRSLGT
jgi:hypothetical protein